MHSLIFDASLFWYLKQVPYVASLDSFGPGPVHQAGLELRTAHLCLGLKPHF